MSRGGRGRGRGNSGINADKFGFARGENPAPVLQPPPLFPPLVNRPLPFDNDIATLLRIKQSLRTRLSNSDVFIKPPVTKSLSDKYMDDFQEKCTGNLQSRLDMARFPKELKNIRKKKLKKIVKIKKINLEPKSINIEEKLQLLEQKETRDTDDEEEKEKDELEDEIGEDDDYDEEIQEEGTDYATSYFDNGEGYLDDEDDNLDDGPTY